jgi:hypothetical protein
MLHTVVSKNAKIIRLTDERWAHITDEHCELAGMRAEVLETIASPDKIVSGGNGELLAVKELPASKFLIVVYREHDKDGFIITAFLTSKVQSVLRRKQVWP